MFLKKSHEAAVVCRTKEIAQLRRKWLLPFTFCRLVTKTMRKKNIPSSWWLKSLAEWWLRSLPKQHQQDFPHLKDIPLNQSFENKLRNATPLFPCMQGWGGACQKWSHPFLRHGHCGILEWWAMDKHLMISCSCLLGHSNPQPPLCLGLWTHHLPSRQKVQVST